MFYCNDTASHQIWVAYTFTVRSPPNWATAETETSTDVTPGTRYRKKTSKEQWVRGSCNTY